MKIVHAIFAGKNSHKSHIDDGRGKPLCGGKCHLKGVDIWQQEEGDPSCVSCIKKINAHCTHPGCGKPIRSSGLCNTHYYNNYNRARRAKEKGARV